MRKLTFSSRIILSLITVFVFILILLSVISFISMRKLYSDASLHTLKQSVISLANIINVDSNNLTEICNKFSNSSDLRISIIDANGVVLADSAADHIAMDNHSDRPEVAAALRGSASTSIRSSFTKGFDMIYAAAPITQNGVVKVAVRLSLSLPYLLIAIQPFIVTILITFVIVFIMMGFAIVKINNTTAKPLMHFMDAAKAWAGGNLNRKIQLFSDPELRPLADTLNNMASELSTRIVEMESQNRELSAILSSMGEAVLSVDDAMVIRLANPLAEEMLGGQSNKLVGKNLLLATGNFELEEMAKACLSSQDADIKIENEFEIYRNGQRKVLANAVPFNAVNYKGLIFVINDITKIKKLELIRKDFVANVSHELKTPITLIKGFLEMIEVVKNPEESKRFLLIIKRHTDRMIAIINDLLSLAAIESGQFSNRMETVNAKVLVQNAIESLSLIISSRHINLDVEIDEGLVFVGNEGLCEQAIINLVDNAIKYGKDYAKVIITAKYESGHAKISVCDFGQGIAQHNLERLFERFYRVDKARSRELGGTGLGLAIVHHIVLAHDGSITVDSVEGSGSTFIMRFPKASITSNL